MDDSAYTLPGVMQFLRAEWRKREQQTIEWDLERAHLKSALSSAQTNAQKLQRERDGLQIETNMLLSRLKSKNVDVEDILAAKEPADELTDQVKQARGFLAQCVGDIKQILQDAGTLTAFDGRDDGDELLKVNKSSVIGVDAVSVQFANNKLIVIEKSSSEPSEAETAAQAVINMYELPDLKFIKSAFVEYTPGQDISASYASYSDKLLVSTETQVHIYSCELELLASQKLDASNLCTGADSSLVLAIDANDVCSCYTLPRDQVELKQLCSINFAACMCFATIEGEPVAVMAQHSESVDGESINCVLLLVDPISGDTQRKIVFGVAARVTAMVCVGEHVLVGTLNGDLLSFNLSRGDVQTEFHSAHRGAIVSLNQLNAAQLVSAGVDGRVCVWSVPELGWRGRFYSHDSAYGIKSVAVANSQIAVAGGDQLVRLYSV